MTSTTSTLSEITSELTTLHSTCELPQSIILLLESTQWHVTASLVEKISLDWTFRLLAWREEYRAIFVVLLELINGYLENTDLSSAKLCESLDEERPNLEHIVVMRV